MKLRYASILLGEPAKIFLGGCPLRCGFCNTPFLLKADTCLEASTASLLNYFVRHRSKTRRICFTGGEPLMQGNALVELCANLKKHGFIVEVETSGYYPEALRDLIPYADRVAIDVKTALEPGPYAEITGSSNPGLVLSNVLRSLAFLEKGGKAVDKEVRTTIVPGVNDSFEATKSVCSYAKSFCDRYVLQQFNPVGPLVDAEYEKKPATPKEDLIALGMSARNMIPRVAVKTDAGTEFL